MNSEALAGSVEVFYAYSHSDEPLREELERHLALLKRQGSIRGWHDRRINPGADWENEISAHLSSADLVLLLVSSAFIASDYCYEKEMRLAMTRHEQGLARVVPIILRPVDWTDAPFGKLQALPRDGKAVTTWANHDEAFLDVVRGIRLIIADLVGQKTQPNPSRSNGSGARSPSSLLMPEEVFVLTGGGGPGVDVAAFAELALSGRITVAVDEKTDTKKSGVVSTYLDTFAQVLDRTPVSDVLLGDTLSGLIRQAERTSDGRMSDTLIASNSAFRPRISTIARAQLAQKGFVKEIKTKGFLGIFTDTTYSVSADREVEQLRQFLADCVAGTNGLDERTDLLLTILWGDSRTYPGVLPSVAFPSGLRESERMALSERFSDYVREHPWRVRFGIHMLVCTFASWYQVDVENESMGNFAT